MTSLLEGGLPLNQDAGKQVRVACTVTKLHALVHVDIGLPTSVMIRLYLGYNISLGLGLFQTLALYS